MHAPRSSPPRRIACKGFSTDGKLKHTIPRGGKDYWIQYNDTCSGTYIRLDTDIIDIDKLTVYEGNWGKWGDTVRSPRHGSYACGARMSMNPRKSKDGFSDNMAWTGELPGASIMHVALSTLIPPLAILASHCLAVWSLGMHYALHTPLIGLRIMPAIHRAAKVEEAVFVILPQQPSFFPQKVTSSLLASAIHAYLIPYLRHSLQTRLCVLQDSNWYTAALTTGSTKRPSKCSRATLKAAGSAIKRPSKCTRRRALKAAGNQW